MTPFYHTQISQIHFDEGDQHQTYIPFFALGTTATFPIPCPFLFSKDKQDHRRNDGERLLQHQSHLQEEVIKQDHRAKWMSSKMRIMRKMMSSDQPTITRKPRRSPSHQHQYQNGNTFVRACSDCNTTKTPLWRSGPQGPKSLCNACGIRQRKARKATAASDVDRMMPFKKRCRFAAGGNTNRKVCFDEIVLRLSKGSACQRAFPQDEKDAAILLMALSCDFICS